MELSSDRLLLQKAALTDAAFFLELLNCPAWLRFIGDRNVKNLADAEAYIQASLIDHYQEWGYGLLKVSLKEKGTPIGICGLLQRDSEKPAEIGFALLPQYEGNGFTTEAAVAVLQFAFSDLNLPEVQAITLENNFSSQRVLEKIGLRMLQKLAANEKGEELLLYSIEKPA